MSPTLLELLVFIVLIGLAGCIGVLIAPYVLTAVAWFWRGPGTPESRDPARAEKNITPPTEHIEKSASNHHGNHPLRK